MEPLDVEFHQLDEKYRTLRVADKRAEGRLLVALREQGQQSPVLVVGIEDGRFVLIDGYRRAWALRLLGRDTVRALLLPMAEADALLYRHRLEQQRPRTAFEDACLLRELVREHGLRQEELGGKLQRSQSWVCRRLALLEGLPVEVQACVHAGSICSHAAMKYLVPLARADRASCIKIVEHLGGERLSTRQMGLLYSTWRTGTALQRANLVERPLLFLKAVAEVRRDVPDGPPDPSREVTRDIETIGGLLRRARRRLVPDALHGSVTNHGLERAWQEVCLAFASLSEALEREGIHAVDVHACRGAPPQGPRVRGAKDRPGPETVEEVRAEDPVQRLDGSPAD